MTWIDPTFLPATYTISNSHRHAPPILLLLDEEPIVSSSPRRLSQLRIPPNTQRVIRWQALL